MAFEEAARGFAGDDDYFSDLLGEPPCEQLQLPVEMNDSPASSSSAIRHATKTMEKATAAEEDRAFSADENCLADDELKKEDKVATDTGKRHQFHGSIGFEITQHVQQAEASSMKNSGAREVAGEFAHPMYRQRRKSRQLRAWHCDPEKRRHASWGSSL